MTIRDWHPVRLAGIPVIIIVVASWLLGWQTSAVAILIAWLAVAAIAIVWEAWAEAKRRLGQ